jgi:4-hydroxythreonine-4-phosphate dehydrogenase
MKLGVTLGDPAGVGPEIVRTALGTLHLPPGIETEVIGTTDGHTPGRPTPDSARAAADALETAARQLLDGSLDGVVTGPVSKNALHEIGWHFPGQTEFFAARAQVENFAMCLTGGPLTVALTTAHIPLGAVPGSLRTPEIVRVGLLLESFLQRRGIATPRIAVAGLNPHAGECGDLGHEEITIIRPAVAILENRPSAAFDGPFPPDTVFHRAASGEFDAVLCMYHDQGLIPLKLLAFDDGVNVTLGLPFVRTSPDHGTAFEIAGRGIARAQSMSAAIRLAASLLLAP